MKKDEGRYLADTGPQLTITHNNNTASPTAIAIKLADGLRYSKRNWRKWAFVLARKLRSFGLPLENRAIAQAVDAFVEHLELDKKDFFIEFDHKWHTVVKPDTGEPKKSKEDLLKECLERAELEPIPLPASKTPPSDICQKVYSLAWQLADYNYPCETFFLHRQAIADLLGTNKMTISRAVSWLVRNEFIYCVRNSYKAQKTCKLYSMNKIIIRDDVNVTYVNKATEGCKRKKKVRKAHSTPDVVFNDKCPCGRVLLNRGVFAVFWKRKK